MKHLLAVSVALLIAIPGTSFASSLKTNKKKGQHLTHVAKVTKATKSTKATKITKSKSTNVAAVSKPAEPAAPVAAPAHSEAVADGSAPESDTPSRRPVIPASVRDGAQ